MNFVLAILAWVVIAAVLVAGIVCATKGALWLLVVGLLGFIFAFGKWGCASQ